MLIKGQWDVLPDLKALHLHVIAQSPSPEFLRGHTLALLAIAQQWDVLNELLRFVDYTTKSCSFSDLQNSSKKDLTAD